MQAKSTLMFEKMLYIQNMNYFIIQHNRYIYVKMKQHILVWTYIK